MASIDAKQVARKVSETIRKGQKVKLGEIIRNQGYSESTSLRPKLVTQTRSFQEAITPIVSGLSKQIEETKIAMSNKDLGKETLATLTYHLDTLIRNYQLLSGGATERQVFILPSEVMERNNLVESKEQPTHTIKDIVTVDK